MVKKQTKKQLAKEKVEKERLEAMALRVDAAREKLRRDREAFKAKAPLLTAEILQGIDYSEEAVVKLKDGSYGKVVIRPISEEEGIGIFAKIDRESLVKESEDLALEDYEFFWTIVSISTGLPADLIKKSFAIGESAMLGARILEMSGITEKSGDEVEDF